MVNKSKKGEVPLFDWDNKKLINFSYNSGVQNLVDTVNSEMIRRLIITISQLNKKTSWQNNIMIFLTIAIIILTLVVILF